MNLKSPLALLLLCLSMSACGSKYITERPTIKDRPPLLDGSQPTSTDLERPSLDQPTLDQSTPDRSTIPPATTLPPPLPLQSVPAVVALRDQAAVATSANDYSRAIGLLERALRISPNDPQTFYDLARNHLATNRPQQAMQLAKRGLSHNPTISQRDALEQVVLRSQASL